jgi:hypothetical protein
MDQIIVKEIKLSKTIFLFIAEITFFQIDEYS